MALFKKPRYSTVHTKHKRDIPAGLWLKCKGCGAVVYRTKLELNLQLCPMCGFHYPVPADVRISQLTDADSFQEIDAGVKSVDVLGFGDYAAKLEKAWSKTGLTSAIVCGTATLEGQSLALGVMDFRFIGASMGVAVGEKVARLAEMATSRRFPLVIVTASGGARMHEGLFSLMQMAKTSATIAAHMDAGLPYIGILTNPTTGGVTASFATQCDVILAEPGALIGFAGPRVIRETTQVDLPEGFQSAEFLVEHGLVDRVIPRGELRGELAQILGHFSATGDCPQAAEEV